MRIIFLVLLTTNAALASSERRGIERYFSGGAELHANNPFSYQRWVEQQEAVRQQQEQANQKGKKK